MWTRKGVKLVIISVGLILLSLVTRNYLLLNIGTTFISYVVAIQLLTRKHLKLSVNRNLDKTRVFENETIEVELKIRNTGFVITYLEVFDVLPKEFEMIKGSNRFFLTLKRGEERVVNYQVRCPRRGVFAFRNIKFRHYSHSFLLYYERTINLHCTAVVLPTPSLIEDMRLISNYPKLLQGAAYKRQIGIGNEFYSIRKYCPGDPFKKINWKAYSRTGKIMVNEYEREDINDIMFVVDARIKTALKNAVENPIDYESRAAASLANFFLKRKDRVGLMIFGEKITILQPESGVRQLNNILNSLAAITPKGDIPLTAVNELLVPNFTPYSPIIIFTPLFKDTTIVDGIRELIVHGFEIVVISPNLPMLLSQVSPLDAEINSMYRDSLISELSFLGVRVIDWQLDQSLNTAISAEVVLI